MEKYTPTPEEVQGHISAAFDSVNLINEVVATPATEETKKTVERNFKHLEIMLAKDWFEAGLTAAQKTDINASVAAGKAYVA
jgi:hypothetical protein